MKLIHLTIALSLVTGSCFGQADSPYSFNWKKDLIAASATSVFAAGGYFATTQLRPLTTAQVNSLDPFVLTGIDRSAIDNWSPKAATASDVLLYSSFVVPGLMMIDKRARKDFLVLGFMYLETAALTIGLTEIAKAATHRARPFVYNPSVSMDLKTNSDARQSFFSGHTSITTALCFLTAKVFSDYSNNPTHEALVWTGAVILPAATASLRYAAGKHFPSDIIAGYIIGGIVGYAVPVLHKRKPLLKGMTLSPFGTRDGAGLYVSYRL